MPTPKPSPTLAQRVYDAAFHHNLHLSEQLADGLAMAEGLAELVGDHADWAEFHGDDFATPSVKHAARAIQAFIAMAAVLADTLAAEHAIMASTLSAAPEVEA